MEKSTSSPALEKYITPIAVVLGAVIIAFALAFGRGGEAPTPNDGTAPVSIEDVKTEVSPSVGEKNAPVTIAMWFDYQCPFCKRFDLDAMKQVYDEYVVNGKVRIIYKDFQFLGPDSMTAGLYARAVWDAYPDKFYEWFTAMMVAQDQEHAGFGDEATVKALTATIAGIDAERVAKLTVDNKAKYEAAMAADRAEGQSLGVNGTPATLIGTQVLSGAQPYAAVKAAIDAELAK
jgi:protein-disulfide isomerase